MHYDLSMKRQITPAHSLDRALTRGLDAMGQTVARIVDRYWPPHKRAVAVIEEREPTAKSA